MFINIRLNRYADPVLLSSISEALVEGEIEVSPERFGGIYLTDDADYLLNKTAGENFTRRYISILISEQAETVASWVRVAAPNEVVRVLREEFAKLRQ